MEKDKLPPLVEIPNGLYQHYKGGLYRVIANGRDEVTLGHVVVYQSLATGEVWIRPTKSFTETVRLDTGLGLKAYQTVSRFTRVKQCPTCEGMGTLLGCAGDKANPECPECLGRRFIPKS